MAINFDEFFETLKVGVVDIAKTEATDFLDQAKDDGQKFLEQNRAKLQRWTKMLAAGDLTPHEFSFLVKGMKDLAQMHALTQAGMAAIRVDRIRVAVIDLVIMAAGKLV